MKQISKIALIAAVFAPLGLAANAAGPLASQSYVHGAVQSRQAPIAGTAGQVVRSTGTAGTVSFTGVDTVATSGSTNLIESGAVYSAVAAVIAGAVTQADIDAAVAAEATARGTAITNAIATEVTNRNAAITTATTDMATQTWVGNQNFLTNANLAGLATETFVTNAVAGEATARGAAITAATTDMATQTWVAGRDGNFATAAQGALAATAVQPAAQTTYVAAAVANLATAASVATVQTNLTNFETRAAGFATADQGALADTALQAANLAGAVAAGETRGVTGGVVYTAIANVNTAIGNLGDLAALDTVGTAQIDANAVTTAEVSQGIRDSLARADGAVQVTNITCPAGQIPVATATAGVFTCVAVVTTYTGGSSTP